jgi:transposase-like protein
MLDRAPRTGIIHGIVVQFMADRTFNKHVFLSSRHPEARLCPYTWCKFNRTKEPKAHFRYNGVWTNQKLKGEPMAHVHLTLEEDVLKELMLGKREEAVTKLLEQVFNSVLQAQATEQLNAEPYERSDERTTYRNGSRTRMLATRVGSLVLHVPKFRDGTFSTDLFSSYQRSEQALLLSLMEMVIQGVSTRKVSEITETLCGTSFSKSTVSALCEQLDPVVDAFRNRPLSQHYPFLMVDAISMKVREQHRIVSKGFLIARGVNDEGIREVLGFTVADGESEAAWNEFFLSLKERGLRDVDLVTSDDHGGLTKAIRKQFCGASWQHCQTHFSKNMLDRTPKKLQPELKVALTDLENAPDLSEATARKNQLIERYREEAPKAMALLDTRFDEITAVYSLPEPYRKRLRTSNSTPPASMKSCGAGSGSSVSSQVRPA